MGRKVALVDGIIDQFHQANLTIFGQTQAAAQLETSKSFCKAFLNRHNIPTANFVTFKNQNNALAHLFYQSFLIVIKVSGLAAGKGRSLYRAIVNRSKSRCYFDDGGKTIRYSRTRNRS